MLTREAAKTVYEHLQSAQPFLYWFEKLGPGFFYRYFQMRYFFLKKPTLFSLIYYTTTNCTLACRECHSWIPYFHHRYGDNFDNFKLVIDKLLHAVDLIYYLRLQGGEPLITKDLDRMVAYACAQPQICYVQIITNGTLLPSDSLLQAMRNPKVLLSISDYSHIPQVRDKLKIEAIKKLCREREREREIRCAHFLTPPGSRWIARLSIRPHLEPIDPEKARNNQRACWCFGAVQPRTAIMLNGTIYPCVPAYYGAINNPDFCLSDDEVVDVRNLDTRALTRAISRFLAKDFIPLCSRCNALEMSSVRHIPGEQIEGKDSDTLEHREHL